MDTTGPAKVGTNANETSAQRDALVYDLSGVFFAALLVEMKLFPSYRTACRSLRRLHRKQMIVRLGDFAVSPNQKPAHIFSSWTHQRIKRDTIASHEIPLSRLVAPFYQLADEIRGPYGVNQATLPDREMDVGTVTYNFEFYTGKQDANQLRKRLSKYTGTDNPVLAVCRKGRYMSKVRAVSVEIGIQDIVYLATYDEVINMPFGKVFRTADDELVAISFPRHDAVHNP
jgi:hypothetical protein